MDETAMNLILEGCRMARNLEESLPDMANRPEHLFSACTEIIGVFRRAGENISKELAVVQQQQRHDQLMEYPVAASGGLEWLHSSQTPAMDLLNAQVLLAAPAGASSSTGAEFDHKMKGVAVRDQEAAAAGGGGGTLEEVAARRSLLPPGRMSIGPEAGAVSTSGHRGGGGSSSSQRQRRRTDSGGGRRVEMVPAPQMGNTEIPPEDGFTWRKYGQKSILHSTFPRSYFRCTHQKLYKCQAKKQVQRLDTDPNIFEITYRGEHTCHFSSTAPSVPPPPPPSSHLHHHPGLSNQDFNPTAVVTAAGLHLDPSPVFPTQWLSMDINTTSGMQPRAFIAPTNPDVSNIINFAGTSSFGAADAGPSGGGIRREHNQVVEYLQHQQQQQPVADMADAMFNSGSSSNNSMDLIFSSMDPKWDSGEKKA